MKNADNNIKVRNWYMDYLSNLGFINKGDIQSDSVGMYKVLASFNAGAGNVKDALTKAKADGKDIYDSWDWVSYLWDEPREYADFILRGIETKGTNKNDSVYKAVSKAKSSVAEKIKDSIK
jgi:soluble lytic murein transglycosylase-like protein